MNFIRIFLSLIVLSPATAFADDAYTLFKQCEKFTDQAVIQRDNSVILASGDKDAIYCMGYMEGVRDMDRIGGLNGKERSLPFCAPFHSNPVQFAQIFVNYAKSHPEKWAEDCLSSVMLSLNAAFPCK
jgi:hypothetical protein